jgi:very-short-patch-repair endonuclease
VGALSAHTSPRPSPPLRGREGDRDRRLALKMRTQLARRLRRAGTEAEREMWLALRELPTGHRFRRQHPIGSHVVDFACPGRKLAIELDGGQHTQQEEEDAACTLEIARRGYRVIRFWNNDVMHNLAGVLEIIRRELQCLLCPSVGEGGVRWALSALCNPHLTPALSAPEGQRGR